MHQCQYYYDVTCQHYCDITEGSTIATDGKILSDNAVEAGNIKHIINLSFNRILTAFCTYIVKHTINCHIYEFEKIQNTNNDVRATQDILNHQPKSLEISPRNLASKSLGVKIENGQVT